MSSSTFRFQPIVQWIIVSFLMLTGALWATSAQAAAYETVQVRLSGSGGALTMQPGEVREVQVEFLNTGSMTWVNDGPAYASVYTYDPKYRRSAFDPGTWEWSDHPGRILEPTVAPGETGTVAFELRAPEVQGEYEETFHLAAEDTAWIDGGEFTFTITVSDQVEELVVEENDAKEGEQGEIVVRTANTIKAVADRPILFTVGVKNTGTTTWKNYGVVSQDIAIASGSGVDFSHPSWNGSTLAYAETAIQPGGVATATFAFKAPSINGTHTAAFDFTANGEVLDGAEIRIPVEVTGGAAAVIEESVDPAFDGPVALDIQQEEPMLRVGILTVDEETDNVITITSEESDYAVRDTQGNLLAEMDRGEQVTAYYKDGRYFFDAGRGLEKSSYGIRFVPEKENAVMKIVNFDYRKTRNGGHAYNTYRHIFEIRYNDHKDRTWVINELPMEYYLRGLAETSNISHEEFQKALITAARTYAYYHYTRGTKRAAEFMHVVAYADDQVYRGYERETMSPRVVQAVEDTRGVIVTYDGDYAITPYFSRSDGRTRAWSEVWGGDVPWAQSVDVPCEEGKTLWGHGVGMSAQGALCMANDGYTWDELLKYFYQGIDLHKRWE